MKTASLLLVFLFAAVSIAEAQFRQDLSTENQYSGVLSTTQSPQAGNWMDALNMTMRHSYSMTFSNFGGQAQNLNAYTNSMLFDISDKLDAQVDVSFLHSPFGNSFLTNNSMGGRIIIDSARLDYQLSDRTNISFEFSQRPYHYSPFGAPGFGAYSPLRRPSLGY
ncbi:MAG: hypothetical protein ACNA78_07930 [Balneolaceae bacterium]